MRNETPGFTILVVTDDGRVRRLRLSRRLLRALIGVAAVAGLAGVALLYAYVGNAFALRRLQLLLNPPAPAPTVIPSAAPTALLAPDLVTAAASAAPALSDRYFEPAISARLALPDRWPLRGWVTSEFGPRANPLTGAMEWHEGIDIAAPAGRPVLATADGEVLAVEDAPGLGVTVTLRHGLGLTTRYGHLERVLVRPGQNVEAGDVVGRSGNTGQTTGPHLHYEVRVFDVATNARPYLSD